MFHTGLRAKVCGLKNEHIHWQPRFHDYIIRNNVADDRIVKYIQNNPHWHQDKFYDI